MIFFLPNLIENKDKRGYEYLINVVDESTSKNVASNDFDDSYLGGTGQFKGRLRHHEYHIINELNESDTALKRVLEKAETDLPHRKPVLSQKAIVVPYNIRKPLETCGLAAMKANNFRPVNMNWKKSFQERERSCNELNIEMNELEAIGNLLLAGFLFGLNVREDPYALKCNVPICGKSFIVSTRFTDHMKTEHEGIKYKQPEVKCPEKSCGQLYVDKATVLRHLKRKHNVHSLTNDYSIGRELLNSALCTVCNNWLSMKHNLMQH